MGTFCVSQLTTISLVIICISWSIICTLNNPDLPVSKQSTTLIYPQRLTQTCSDIKAKILLWSFVSIVFNQIFFLVSPFPFTSLPPLSLSVSVLHPPDLIKSRTRRTRWRRTASALWPTDRFRSRGILCTQISLWRSAKRRPGLSRAKERGRRGGRHTLTGGNKTTRRAPMRRE